MSEDTAHQASAEGVLPAVSETVVAIDGLVPAAPTTANAVLEDASLSMAWLGVVFATCAILLVPWVFYLGFALPERQESAHYALAWAGFDGFLFVALAATAYAVLRRSTWVGISAGVAAALLVTDAWFDVVTSPSSSQLLQALAMAVVVELPLAAACLWVCVHADRLSRRRIGLLTRRLGRAEEVDTPRR